MERPVPPGGPTVSSLWQVTPLSGSVATSQLYVVAEAQGAGGTPLLPSPEVTGTIPMSATPAPSRSSNTTATDVQDRR